MVQCSYCGENVAMPYKCSLCGERFCSKHRLAENHECPNIGMYSTEEYRKHKIQKKREMETIKSGVYSQQQGYGGSRGMGRTRASSFMDQQSFWSVDTPDGTAAIGGAILALSAIIGLIAYNNLLAQFPRGLILITGAVFSGAILFVLLFRIRELFANREGFSTAFEIWPVGVAITLVTSLLRFRFLIFGFFNNYGGSPKSQSNVGVATILSCLGIWAIGIFILPLSLIVQNIPSGTILYLYEGLIFATQEFLWYGILIFIPIWDLDGKKIYEYDRQKFWILLVILILAFIIQFTGF